MKSQDNRIVHSESQPLLTIAIPTFNRSIYLSELLEILCSQLSEETVVELLISDNCSTDDTPAVIDSFRSRGLRFRYMKNDVNIGPDANFIRCFNEARGKYFWLLGDDDVLIPGALKKIIYLLQQGEPSQGLERREFDVVYLSSFSFSGEYRPDPGNSADDIFKRFAELMTDGNYFLKRVHALIGLISAIIVNKNELIANGRVPLRNLDNSFLMQLAWIFPLIHRDMRVGYVWERLVGYRVYNSGGWSPCKVFGVNMTEIASLYFADDPRLARDLMNSVLCAWLPPVIVDMRQGRHPALETESCSKLLEPIFKKNWRFWIYVYPLEKLPLWSMRILYRFLDRCNKVKRAMEMLSRHIFARPKYFIYGQN